MEEQETKGKESTLHGRLGKSPLRRECLNGARLQTQQTSWGQNDPDEREDVQRAGQQK